MAHYMDNTPLSKEEQVEEEMRQELKDVGLYYDNMSVDEMKQLINVLNESKNDSRIPTEDLVDNAASFGETISAQDTSKVTDNSTNRPLPSFSYRQAVASGTSTNQSPPLEEITNSNNKTPQASSSNSYDKNYTPNSPDNEPIYDRNSNSNFKKDEEYPMLTNRYETRSRTGDGSRTTRAQEAKKTSLTNTKRASLERWNLNPLDFVRDKNTTSLCESQDSISDLEEPAPYCSEQIDMDSEEFDKLCKQMEEKLSTLNKQCMVELAATQKLASPMKVGSSKQVPPYG